MYIPDSVWEFKVADKIKFGLGAVDEIDYEVGRFGAETVVVVTDSGVLEAGLTDSVVNPLENAGYDVAVFDGVESDPAIEIFNDCVKFTRDRDGDLIIGLGGGSSLDVAKTTGIIVEHGGEPMDYIAPPTGEGKAIPGPGLPTIAIPTTSGTGSEVTPAAVISLTDQEAKAGISSQYQRPNLALVDPQLTVSLPPEMTASTGLDALIHAIEGFTTLQYDEKPKPNSPGDRPVYGGTTLITDAFARQAIQLISKYLRRAYNNGEDLEARIGMSQASLFAGIAFSNAGLGAVHALSFPLGAKFHVPHGMACATLFPAVMDFNATSDFEKFSKIAELMGENTDGLSRDEAAKKAAVAVEKLCADLGIPDTISEFGVTEDDLPQMAEDGMKVERLLAGNPRRVRKEDALSIYTHAFES